MLYAAEQRYQHGPATSCVDELETLTLGYERMTALFMVLAAGMVASALLLVVESVTANAFMRKGQQR